MRHYSNEEFRTYAVKGLIEGITAEAATRYEDILTGVELAMANATTVDTIQRLRKELEKRITSEIQNFEQGTGCTVEMVLLTRVDPMGQRSKTVAAEVEVHL